jgi:hypothetical protein
MSVPAMATGNPIGALVAHPVMHVTAVTHEYFGSDPGYLPPKLTGYPDRLGGTTAWAFAGVWIALLAGVLWKWRHEVFGPSPGSRGTPTIT